MPAVLYNNLLGFFLSIPNESDALMPSNYFSDQVEQSFQTSSTGERLFLHINGFWAKPYIVPDQETEKRLAKKQFLMWQIVWITVYVTQAYLFVAVPKIIRAPLWFLGDLIAMLLFFYAINFFLFRKELQTLKRSSVRFPLVSYYSAVAKRSSAMGLLFGILAGLFLLWVLFRIMADESSAFVFWFFILIGCFSVASSAYTYYLKVVVLRSEKGADNNSEA